MSPKIATHNRRSESSATIPIECDRIRLNDDLHDFCLDAAQKEQVIFPPLIECFVILIPRSITPVSSIVAAIDKRGAGAVSSALRAVFRYIPDGVDHIGGLFLSIFLRLRLEKSVIRNKGPMMIQCRSDLSENDVFQRPGKT